LIVEEFSPPYKLPRCFESQREKEHMKKPGT